MLKRLYLCGATALATLALVALPAFAAIGTQNPDLTVALTITPTVVRTGDEVTIYKAVTNNTKKTLRVVTEFKVTSPSGIVDSSSKSLIMRPGQTVSTTEPAIVIATEKGTYTVTYSATDRNGTSWATEYLTIE